MIEKAKYKLFKRFGRRKTPWVLMKDGVVLDRFHDFLHAWQVLKYCSKRYTGAP